MAIPSRRNFSAGPEEIAGIINPDGWNDYLIRCEGPRIRHWLNGHLTVDYTEPDDTIPRTGRIGLQVHSGDPTELHYRDITILELSQ